MARDSLVPHDVGRASSAWDSVVLHGHDPVGVQPNEGVDGVLRDESDRVTLVRSPPMPTSNVFVNLYPSEPGPIDERPLNDAMGLKDQQTTLIEVVKHDGEYHLLLDGHRQPRTEDDKLLRNFSGLEKSREKLIVWSLGTPSRYTALPLALLDLMELCAERGIKQANKQRAK